MKRCTGISLNHFWGHFFMTFFIVVFVLLMQFFGNMLTIWWKGAQFQCFG
jgi:hypothetical protein